MTSDPLDQSTWGRMWASDRLRYGLWLARKSALFPLGSLQERLGAIQALLERREQPRQRFRPRQEHRHLNAEET